MPPTQPTQPTQPMPPSSRRRDGSAFASRRRTAWLVVGLFAVAGVAIAAGCNNPCARSQDREIECVGKRDYDAGPPIDCDLTDECLADCVNDAGCDQIVAYLEVAAEAGTPSKPTVDKAQAIFACRKICQTPAPIPQ
jgi:hypothetical protein